MNPTPQRDGGFAAFLPGALAVCAAALLGGCVVAPYYDAYGNPIAPAVTATASAYAYDSYYSYPYYPYGSYGPYYGGGPAYYPAPDYGGVWIDSGGCWGCHRGWGWRR